MQLHPSVAALSEKCRELRRSLHQIPETGFDLYQTSAFLRQQLQALNPDRLDSFAGTGLRAVFLAENAEETIAFRADMDGLALPEENDFPYASCRSGFMHGCGHDGHMTILLLLAELLSRHRSALKHNVVLLFQPGEEGYGGAKRMIAEGALENPHVDRIYGLHLWPTVPKGKIGVRWGMMMASTTEFDIIIHGRSAHGASPQMGIDAVVVAAELISMLQTAITRNLDPHEDALLTIGRISGGTARNVIADRVELNCTLRVASDAVYARLRESIHHMVDGLALATGARFQMIKHMQYPCVDNPRPMVEDFYTHFDMSDMYLVEPVMAAEDFACYQTERPGLFFFLGTGDEAHKEPLHSSRFDFDEDVLLLGVEAMARVAGLADVL